MSSPMMREVKWWNVKGGHKRGYASLVPFLEFEEVGGESRKPTSTSSASASSAPEPSLTTWRNESRHGASSPRESPLPSHDIPSSISNPIEWDRLRPRPWK